MDNFNALLRIVNEARNHEEQARIKLRMAGDIGYAMAERLRKQLNNPRVYYKGCRDNGVLFAVGLSYVDQWYIVIPYDLYMEDRWHINKGNEPLVFAQKSTKRCIGDGLYYWD